MSLTQPLPPPRIDPQPTLKVWAVYSGGDAYTRTKPVVVAVYSTETGAQRFVNQQPRRENYSYGELDAALRSDGRVLILTHPEAYPLDVTLAEERRRVRHEALSKLTPEERWALGVER